MKHKRNVKFNKNELDASLTEASITKIMLAKKLGVSRDTVLMWFRQGHMPRHRWDSTCAVISNHAAPALPKSEITIVRDHLVGQLQDMGYKVTLEGM